MRTPYNWVENALRRLPSWKNEQGQHSQNPHSASLMTCKRRLRGCERISRLVIDRLKFPGVNQPFRGFDRMSGE